MKKLYQVLNQSGYPAECELFNPHALFKTKKEKLKQFGVTKIIHLERVDVYLFYNGNKLINELKL